MTSPQTTATTDPQDIVAALQQRLDAALSEKATLDEALATRDAALTQRNSEFGERIEYQAATLDVLKAMSASPGDAQPVFDLIVRHATELCDVPAATLNEYDGELVHMRSSYRSETIMASSALAAYMQLFPMRPTRGSITCRAILDRQIVHIRDLEADPELAGFVRELGHRSQVSVPLIRNGLAIGAISITAREPGGFSDSQVELLQTFAEQAVIAITSAETYRALQTRTSDLQETLEYQTATSDVLRVISRSTFDLQPVLDTVAQTAAKLCNAEQATIYQREGGSALLVANCGFPAEYEAHVRGLGAVPLDRYPQHPTVTLRTLIEGSPVHIHDVAAVPGYPEAAVRLGKQRTSLGVPLLREGEPVGVIVLARQRVEPFTERQIELVSTFADQAVIAIENTRLITEQREALEQQTATAEVLQVINASPGNLTPVFDAMLEKAMHLCEAAFGELHTYEGGRFRAVALRGVPMELSNFRMGNPVKPNPGTVTGRIVEGMNVVHIDDLMAEEAYQTGSGQRRALVDLGGARSYVAVPLRTDNRLLGTIGIYRQEVRPFSDKQIALLKNFAAQAVIAMENARLLTEQQEALEQQTATAEVLQVINASPGNLAPVFDAMLDKAMRLCGATIGGIYRYNGQWFDTVALRGVTPGFAVFSAENPMLKIPGSPPSVVLETKRPVQVVDIAATDQYRDGTSAYGRALVDIGGIRAVLNVPLLKDGAVLGFITIYRAEPGAFPDKQIALLENFAAQAVIAMENARLLTEQQEALEQQTATAEVLQVINANPGNLTPVFDAILDKAHTLCGAAIGSLVLFDGTYFRAVATHGWPNSITALFSEPAGPNRARQRLVDGERFVQVADVRVIGRGPNSAWGDAVVESTDARTMLLVPLRKDGALLGFISAFRPEVRAFSDKEIALLENFAAQAVIAMENARLLTEQQEALEQQTATAEVLQVINASPGDLVPVFDTILAKALRLCEAAFGSLVSYDGEYFQVVATRGLSAGLAKALRERGPLLPSKSIAYDQIVRGADIVHIPDITATGTQFPSSPNIDQDGARTTLFVALRGDHALFGAFVIYRKEVRLFSDKQIALLKNFAAQAVIAMENARLLTETREALEQQTATAEVLEVINSSPGDLGPVFQALLGKAHTLCEASFGALMTYDGERFHAVAHQGTPAPFREFLGSGLLPGPRDPFGLMVEGAAYSHIHDLLEVVARYPGEPLPRAAADLGGIRTLLVVPLRKDSELLGVITAYRQETRPFSDRQIALLQNFAAQAVIAMENARLLTEQQEALEQQTATAEVLQVINASPGDLAPVFEAMLEKAIRLCEAEFGTLRTWDGERFHLGAAHGDPELIEWTKRQRPFTPINGNFPLGRIVRGAEIVRITDALLASYQTSSGFGAMAAAIGFRSGIAVALRKDATLLGAITVYRKNEIRPFTDKQIALLQSFAAQAVIAMENARLLDEIRQRQEELRVTFDNMGDGVAMFDETQYLAAWNRKFQDILDLPDALLEQRRTYEEHLRFLAARGDFGPGVDTVEQIEELVASTGQPYGYERTRPDGRVIEIRRNPVPDGGFVLIYSDITERKRSEEEIRAARDAAETALRELRTAQANLIQAEKMASLGQLTAGIAHEIKNPLNFVNNFAALSVDLLGELKETAAPGFAALTDKQRAEVEEVSAMLTSNLEKITEHGKRADGIVKAMLEHSRGSSTERRLVDLNALIDEALNLAYHGARAQDQSFNITLERDFGAGIAPIEVNPQDITRVFLNLFANGFYATTRRARDGGDARFVPTLKVTTIDAGEAVEIHVRDNGIGIPADIRDKLFQPFFTTKPTGEGTGLGLSITYDIVTQQHGGSIAVDSKVGDYSEFTIRLPRNP